MDRGISEKTHMEVSRVKVDSIEKRISGIKLISKSLWATGRNQKFIRRSFDGFKNSWLW